MSKELTLGYLGYRFQTEFINQILHPANKKFSDRIIDIVHAKYFDNEYFRLIIATVKDYYESFEKLCKDLKIKYVKKTLLDDEDLIEENEMENENEDNSDESSEEDEKEENQQEE